MRDGSLRSSVQGHCRRRVMTIVSRMHFLNVFNCQIYFMTNITRLQEGQNGIKMSRVGEGVDLLMLETPHLEIWSVYLVTKPNALKRPIIVCCIINERMSARQMTRDVLVKNMKIFSDVMSHFVAWRYSVQPLPDRPVVWVRRPICTHS